MPKLSKKQWAKACNRKDSYSASTARRILPEVKKRNPGVKLRIYKCDFAEFGEHWHLTHHKEKR